jgi:hypothetical protein
VADALEKRKKIKCTVSLPLNARKQIYEIPDAPCYQDVQFILKRVSARRPARRPKVRRTNSKLGEWVFCAPVLYIYLRCSLS